MQIEFPVYVYAKDCGEIQKFLSIAALQEKLEKIDVENDEYLAWDKNGHPLSLCVQKPMWLKLERHERSGHPDLKTCLEKYAAAVGVDIELGEEGEQYFNDLLERIETSMKQARSGLFGRVLRKGRKS